MNLSSLSTAVEFAAKATGKTGCPETETIMFAAGAGRGAVTGTNGDLFMRHEFECDAKIHACVPAKRFKNVLAHCPADEIELKHDGKALIISAPGFHQVLETLPPDNFPPMFDVEGERFTLPAEAIHKCLPAASTDPSKKLFNSVYLDPVNKAVVGLNRKSFHVVTGIEIPKAAIIPTMAAHAISILSGIMRVSDRFFAVEGDEWSVAGKVLDGTFINWKKADRPAEKEIVIPDGFAESIQRCVGCSKDAALGRAEFHGGDVSMPGSTVACGLDTGFKFAMNPEMLVSAVKIAGPGAMFGYTNAGTAFRIRNGDFLAAIQPQTPDM